MPTECNPDFFGFAPVEGREVVAAFDAGAITSDAGALLLGAADHAIGLTKRLAACFHDERRPHLIEHEVATLVGQRVFGIALGYEDLNDHDELRHDPMLAVLSGKLAAKREEHCAPVAGKIDVLNRLELSRRWSRRATTRSVTIRSPSGSGSWSTCSWTRTTARRKRSFLDLDATDDPVHGNQEGRFFHGYYDCYFVTCRCTCFVGATCWRPGCSPRVRVPRLVRWRRWCASLRTSVGAGRAHAFCCAPIAGSCRRR